MEKIARTKKTWKNVVHAPLGVEKAKNKYVSELSN